MKDHHRMRAWNGTRYFDQHEQGWFYMRDCPEFEVSLEDIQDSEIELCSGLKDINGKLIYEGDIDQHNDVVVNSRGSFWLGGDLIFEIVGIEIIGNIHQNPELLK